MMYCVLCCIVCYDVLCYDVLCVMMYCVLWCIVCYDVVLCVMMYCVLWCIVFTLVHVCCFVLIMCQDLHSLVLFSPWLNIPLPDSDGVPILFLIIPEPCSLSDLPVSNFARDNAVFWLECTLQSLDSWWAGLFCFMAISLWYLWLNLVHKTFAFKPASTFVCQ